MPQDFLNKNFKKFRESLLLYSGRFNVSYEVREELINDVILIAIDSFDHDKGSFESYCRVILKNKILNFKRDKKDLFIFISLDDCEEMLPDYDISIESKENIKSVVLFFEKLKVKLSNNELELFNEIYKICDSINKVNITKASGNIGIGVSTAWNIFRKIQRKASKLYKEMKAANVELLFTLAESSYFSTDAVFERKDSYKPYISFQKDTSFTDRGYNNFISKLNMFQINKISTIYSEQLSA